MNCKTLKLLLISLAAISLVYCSNVSAELINPDIRFAIIGDHGDGNAESEEVSDLVSSWDVEFVVSVGDARIGDIDYDEAVGQFYCEFLAGVTSGLYCDGNEAVRNNFFVALGNHDNNDNEGLDEYLNYFSLPGEGIQQNNFSDNELYYDVVLGPVHLIFLNSDVYDRREAVESPWEDQKTWVRETLQASTQPFKIVVMHHSPYSSANHGDTPPVQLPFESWGADAVITGHDHVYERLSLNGIPYFVNGLGGRRSYELQEETANPGSRIRYNESHGAMRVTATNGIMEFEFINSAGEIIDTHWIARNSREASSISTRTARNDAEEDASTGDMDIDSGDLELGSDHGMNQYVGMLWKDIYFPDYFQISEAYIRFTHDESSAESATLNLNVAFEQTADPHTFKADSKNISNRIKDIDAENIFHWNNVQTWEADIPSSDLERDYQTPDLSWFLDDIVHSGLSSYSGFDWQNGNNIAAIVWSPDTLGDGDQRSAESYNGDSSDAPILVTEYLRPAIAAPEPGSILPGPSTTFAVEVAAAPLASIRFDVGTSNNDLRSIFSEEISPTPGISRVEVTVDDLPTDGTEVWVSAYIKLDGRTNYNEEPMQSVFIAAQVRNETCGGHPVTCYLQYGDEPTEDNDVILGTNTNDIIFALGGDDIICGRAGDDVIHAGAGADIVYGGDGKDRIYGGNQGDTLYGGAHADRIFGGRGKDTLYGNRGNDGLNGGPGSKDRCYGQKGRWDFFKHCEESIQ